MLVVEQQTLPSTIVMAVADLSKDDRAQMYRLYSQYYSCSDETIFQADLQSKNYAVLLRDTLGIIQGFSTLALYQETYDQAPVNIIYSGDTIIDKAFWGQPLLPKAWLQFVGQIAAQSDIPLYWLLIVKGHRTYRYLQLFSQNYFPRHDAETPADMQQMIDYLARHRFGDAYDAECGLVFLPEPRSFLSPDLALIPEKDLRRPEVQFFLSRNPNYAQGDEMVCLCKLSQNNLTRMSLKWFMEGAQQIVK